MAWNAFTSLSRYHNQHVGVLIGRFQPFHNGHLNLITTALNQNLRSLRIFVGSANSGRTIKNPFLIKERIDMIIAGLSQELTMTNQQWTHVDSANGEPLNMVDCPDLLVQLNYITFEHKSIYVEICGLNDYCYNDDKWAVEFLQLIRPQHDVTGMRYVLLGYQKDKSSYYLDLFPELEQDLTKTPYLENDTLVDATKIREVYFGESELNTAMIKALPVPQPVREYLWSFYIGNEQTWKYIHNEMKFVEQYKESWKDAPYPPIFVTTDALVQQDNHILLIKRLTQPGKDTWAIPGGFLNQEETLEEGMIRELREETGLKVPVPVIRGSIVNREVIDVPGRSSRGRTITHVFHIKLSRVSKSLPHIKGASDAKQAEWIPIHEVVKMKPVMFEDHWDIISKLIGF